MNFSNICRTCLSDKNLSPLFLNPKDHVQYATAVYITLGIKVHPHDGLPQKMCKACVEHLNNCLRFRKQCREVEEKLLKYRKPVPVRPKKKKKANAASYDGEVVNQNIEVRKRNGVTYVVKTKQVEEGIVKKEPIQSIVKVKKKVYMKPEPQLLTNFNKSTSTSELTNQMLDGEYQEDDDDEDQPVDAKYTEYDWLEDDVEDDNAAAAAQEQEAEPRRSDSDYIIPDLNHANDDNEPLISANKEKPVVDDSAAVNRLIGDDENGCCDENERNEGSMFVHSDEEHDTKVGVEQMKMEICDVSTTDLYTSNMESQEAVHSDDLHLTVYYPESEGEERKYVTMSGGAANEPPPASAPEHSSAVKILKCGYCKTEFSDREVLIRHVASCKNRDSKRAQSPSNAQSNSKIQMQECRVCHNMIRSDRIWHHRVMAHSTHSVVCEHCGKNFKSKHRLIAHKRSKHGYEKLKCSYCDGEFASDVARKNHERRHRGEKPYVCDLCGSKFHASYLLAQHKKFHRQIRMFKCDQCPAAFKTKLGLYNHQRGRHSALLVRCELCHRTYSCRHYAMKHLRYMHEFRGGDPPLEVFLLDPPQDLPSLELEPQGERAEVAEEVEDEGEALDDSEEGESEQDN